MKLIFVDTSGWDALADRGDEHHVAALQFRDKIAQKRRLVTSNYVLDELYTLLLINIGYEKAVSFKRRLDLLISEGVLHVLWVNETIANRAWEVFEQFNVDKQGLSQIAPRTS